MSPNQTAYHVFMLVAFLGVFAYACKAVSRLRNTSPAYNAWLLPFAYFSLSSWIFWVSQYAILIVNSFNHSQSDVFKNTGLSLGIMQNALWASSLWSLYSKQFPKVSLTVIMVIMFCIVTALASYQSTIFTSQSLAYFAAVSSGTVFLSFFFLLKRLRVNILFAVVFVIHGYFQWFWYLLWVEPLIETPGKFQAFPAWYIALLILWTILISEMSVTFRVMISSTVFDLTPEREAAENAIRGLQLGGIRAETFGSLPGTPEAICASWAEQCDIFVLIIGERYGSIIESKGISVVEFEYRTARAQNPEKILVYVKDGVKRESPLEEFRQKVEDFEHGHFTARFTTAEDLHEKIQLGIRQWLDLQAHPKPRKRVRRNSAGNNWLLTSL